MSAELFRVVTPTDALSKIFDALESTIGDERVPLDDALFRITAAPVYASEQSPSFSRSAMDGFAVHAADTYGASDGLPSHMSVHGEVRMGRSVAEPLSSGTARLIHTGGMMPPGADAVVMVEHTQTIDERAIEVTRPVAPGENVIQAGRILAGRWRPASCSRCRADLRPVSPVAPWSRRPAPSRLRPSAPTDARCGPWAGF